MKRICLSFQVHQPYRLKNLPFFEIGNHPDYFDDELNGKIMRRVAKESYGPTNELLLRAVKKYGAAIKLNFAISGTAIDQLESYAPEVLDSFKRLAQTGQVEFLGQTYSNSLAAVKSRMAFYEGITAHSERILDVFGQRPKVFSNSGFPFTKEMEKTLKTMGFSGLIVDGSPIDLKNQTPNAVYRTTSKPPLRLLMDHKRLSEDIAHRFDQKDWDQWPLTVEKYTDWLRTVNSDAQVVNLVMDYAVFGEHHKRETGVFDFLEYFLNYSTEDETLRLATASAILETAKSPKTVKLTTKMDVGGIGILQKEMQHDALHTLLGIGRKLPKSSDENIRRNWLRLQSLDHFLYMDTTDGNLFNPYETPYDAFLKYMNVLADFDLMVSGVSKKEPVRAKRRKKKAKSSS